MAREAMRGFGSALVRRLRDRRGLGFRAGALALALIALTISGPAEARPERIASMNLCTDQITLALVERERVASLSALVAQADYSNAADDVAGIRLNHGLSEEILPLEPDFVVAGTFSAQPTVMLLSRLGHPTLVVDFARSIDDVRTNVRTLGGAFGEAARAEALIEAMDGRLAAAAGPTGSNRPTALYLQPNGYTAGGDSLIGDVIGHAGLTNLGAEAGISGHGRLSMETLLALAPDILITDESRDRAPALAYEILEHPAVTALLARSIRVQVPTRLWICGLPAIAEAVELLADARRRVTGEAGS
ncbi:MAG: ABC transporter substrate-binding protein [Rhodospirillales bacterium]|nr:MAG: ABC transporter substrate-binding protein [Rhodospirillales bacterium]